MPTLNNPQANQAPAPAKSAELMAAEREALANTLKTRGEGGSVSKTFAGTDVPKLLDESPGTRQLLEEAIRIQTGQNSRQQTAPPKDIEAAGIVDSNASQTNFNNLTNELAAAEQASNESSSAALASSIPTSTAYDDSEAQAMIGQSREQNAAQLEQQIEGIRASFVGRRQEQQYQNRSQTGATRAMMARSGAGGFASGKTAVSNRVAEGQRAMNALAAVEAQAINMAKAAAAGRDTEMLAKSLAAAEQARVSQNEVRQEQFQNYIAERNMALQDKEASYRSQDRAREDLSQLSNLSPEAVAKLEPAQIQQMEMDSGLPEGYFNAFQQTQQELANASSQQAQFDQTEKLLDMALKLPSGMTFDVGGMQVTGLNAGDHKIFQSADNAGNVTFTTVNPTTGEVINTNTLAGVGRAARPTGGSGSGGGGGRRVAGSTLPPGVASDLAGLTSLIGTDPETGEVVTTQDVYNAIMTTDAVAGNFELQELIAESLMRTQDLGSGSKKGNSFKYIETEIDGDPAIVPFNVSTGAVGEPTFVEKPPEPEGSEGGLEGGLWGSFKDWVSGEE